MSALPSICAHESYLCALFLVSLCPQLAMINIHHRLEELSTQCLASSASSLSSTSGGRGDLLLFRTRRSLPGGGLYKILDDVRPVLQIHDELVFEVRKEDLLKVT